MARGWWSAWSRAEWVEFGWLLVALFVVVPVVLVGLGSVPWRPGWFSGNKVSTAILWATGMAILAYTIEAQRMRREMVRQNDIAIQPVVVANVDKRDGPYIENLANRDQLQLRNIGRGVALCVQIPDFVLPEEATRYVGTFARTDYIQAGHEVTVMITAKREIWDGKKTIVHEEAPGRVLSQLDPNDSPEEYALVVSYQDISGAKYESVTRMGKGGIRWEGARKV